MAQKLTFKRGDTFTIQCNIELDITGWLIESQIRSGDKLITVLELELVNPLTGIYKLKHVDTKLWPVGELQCDIQYTTNTGQIISTETFIIEVMKDITI